MLPLCSRRDAPPPMPPLAPTLYAAMPPAVMPPRLFSPPLLDAYIMPLKLYASIAFTDTPPPCRAAAMPMPTS